MGCLLWWYDMIDNISNIITFSIFITLVLRALLICLSNKITEAADVLHWMLKKWYSLVYF